MSTNTPNYDLVEKYPVWSSSPPESSDGTTNIIIDILYCKDEFSERSTIREVLLDDVEQRTLDFFTLQYACSKNKRNKVILRSWDHEIKVDADEYDYRVTFEPELEPEMLQQIFNAIESAICEKA